MATLFSTRATGTQPCLSTAETTFSFIDPNSFAQPSDPAGVTFCCDQVVNYMPSIDMFVWLMQYGPSTGDNIQRLAFAKTDDVKAGKWRIFDIATEMLGVPKFFMDFPDLCRWIQLPLCDDQLLRA